MKHSHRYKARLGIAALASTLLVLTACSGDGGGTSNGGEGTGASNSTTMIVAVSAEPANLNAAINTDQNSQVIAAAVYDALVEVDRAGEIHPALATSWEISDDGTQYIFHLREGVKWHDGEDFTADDVIFSLTNALALNPSGAQIAALIEDASAPDDHTVVVQLSSSYGPFLSSMRRMTAVILPEHIYGGTEIGDNQANMAPVGTGPFQFAEWRTGEQVVLERSADYWGETPQLERIVYRFIPDGSTRINTLTTGEVDYVMQYWVPYTAVAQLETRDNLHLEHARVMPTEEWFIFNTENEYLSDVQVRQALLQGIDREAINDSVFNGTAVAARGIIPPGIDWAFDPQYDLMEMYPFDLEAANRLLDEAGYERDANGNRFSLEYVYSNTNDPAQGPIGDILKSSWAQLGVDLTLTSFDTAVWVEKIYTTHEFDVAMSQMTTRNDPALGISRVYMCVEPGRAYTNASSHCDPELDELWDEAASLTAPEERAVVYSEVQERLSEIIPTVPIIDLTGVDVISSRFGNIDKFFDSAGHPELGWQHLTVE